MKNTARMAALTASILLCGLSIPLFAQAPPSGPCPPGAVPIPGQGRCGSPAEASANRGGGSSRPVYTEVWEDRYGAIAEDPVKGGGGVSEDEKSKRNADRIAISRCGTNQCKVVSRVRNTCQAIAYGEGLRFFGDGASEQLAANDAITKCERKGTKCELKYTGCSLPVRVK